MKQVISLAFILVMAVIVSFSSVTALAAEDDNSSSITPEIANTLTTLKIDNQNVYAGMSASYSKGYSPSIGNHNAKVILPIIANGEIKDNSITAKATMDFAEGSPFVCKNYEKTVVLENNKVSGSSSVSGFLVIFDLELLETRKNGNYPVTINITASDKNGNPVNLDSTVYVSIIDGKSAEDKTIKMQFDELQLPDEVTVSDIIEAPIKAINLSKCKVYNVRATMNGDGLVCKSTAFIGDMEPGTSMDSLFSISVTSLSGDLLYGSTQGTVTYVYEDENGQEYSVEKPFSTNIKSPFSEKDDEENDNPNQWWVIMIIVAVILISIIAVYFISFFKKRSKD